MMRFSSWTTAQETYNCILRTFQLDAPILVKVRMFKARLVGLIIYRLRGTYLQASKRSKYMYNVQYMLKHLCTCLVGRHCGRVRLGNTPLAKYNVACFDVTQG